MSIHGWSMDGTVTGIVRQAGQGLHPWMVHGWHSNCGIHGYFDKGRLGKVAIHGWSMDGTTTGIVRQAGQGLHPWVVHGWHSNCGIHGYFDRGGWARWPSMDVPWMAQ